MSVNSTEAVKLIAGFKGIVLVPMGGNIEAMVKIAKTEARFLFESYPEVRWMLVDHGDEMHVWVDDDPCS